MVLIALAYNIAWDLVDRVLLDKALLQLLFLREIVPLYTISLFFVYIAQYKYIILYNM